MRKILLSLVAAALLAACAFSFSACSLLDVADGVDIVLGASRDAEVGSVADSDADDWVFMPTSAYDIPSENIPVIDVPDATPATAGIRFALNEARNAYTVISFNTYGLPVPEGADLATLETDIYVPYSYEGLPVIGIAPGAFASANITSIALPKTLLYIGEKAFHGSNVADIEIPASVLYIAQDAFIECNKLASITVEEGSVRYTVNGSFLMDGTTLVRGVGNGTIGADVTEIAPFAFKGCDALTEITVPATVTKIGNGAFAACPNLVSAVIEAEITELPDNTFDGCTSLTSLSFPETVTMIGYAACRNTGFVEYTIPASVAVLESYAFADCASLRVINFVEGLNSIGGCAFQNCVLISSIVFPEGLTFVGGSAFRECESLDSITISSTVATIGSAAFYNCDRLTAVHVPKNVTVMGDCVFYGVEKSFKVTMETTYTPIDWSDNWNVREILNALESGKVQVDSLYIQVQRPNS